MLPPQFILIADIIPTSRYWPDEVILGSADKLKCLSELVGRFLGRLRVDVFDIHKIKWA